MSIGVILRALNFEHSKKDAAFGAKFEAEKKLRDDVGEAMAKIATWRRVRAFQVKAVVETDKWKIGAIGAPFMDQVLKPAFPNLVKRIRQSAVPQTIIEELGWHFNTVGKSRLATDERFKHLVAVAKRMRR